MKNSPHKPALIATLLDRLIDDMPENERDPSKSRYQQIEQLNASLRRDLENLLNTRKAEFTWQEKWTELNQSIVAYGISDITGRDLSSTALQSQLCEEFAKAIETFETRLEQVKVKLLETDAPSDRTLRLRIEGVLIGASPEYIAFESILQTDIGSVQIRGAD